MCKYAFKHRNSPFELFFTKYGFQWYWTDGSSQNIVIFKVVGQRSRSPGQIFRRGDMPRFAFPLLVLSFSFWGWGGDMLLLSCQSVCPSFIKVWACIYSYTLNGNFSKLGMIAYYHFELHSLIGSYLKELLAFLTL
jgi:hypothetical protein